MKDERHGEIGTPEYFGMIVLARRLGTTKWRVDSYLFKNEKCPKELQEYRVPLQRIQDLTTIPFLHRIAPELEELDLVEESKSLKYEMAMRNRIGLLADPLEEPASAGARDEGGPAQQDYGYNSDYVKSRPDGKDKIGKKGTVIPINANYYEVKTAPTWALYEYRVDYTPELNQSFLRKKLFKKITKDMDFGYMFDGTMLYTPREFTENLDPNGAVIFKVKSKEGTQYDIKIKDVGQVDTGSSVYLAIYNHILQRYMAAMNMVEMGQYFLDHSAAITVPPHPVKLWLGKCSLNIILKYYYCNCVQCNCFSQLLIYLFC